MSLHYSIHVFHFALFKPYEAILLAWLDNIAKDSLAHIRKFQLKRYIAGDINVHYISSRIMTVSIDLDSERDKAEVRVAGKPMSLPGELDRLIDGIPHNNGRQELDKVTLLRLFDTVGWH